jgi:ketosteroid isomerase-like protein
MRHTVARLGDARQRAERSVEFFGRAVMVPTNSSRFHARMKTPLETAQAFKMAISHGDVDAARKLMHDDMTFQGPLEAFDRPEPYLEALRKLGAIVERVDMKKMFVDGDDVCLLYDMVTRTPAGTAFIAEWLTFRGGKIASIRTVFDARPFAAMFGK